MSKMFSITSTKSNWCIIWKKKRISAWIVIWIGSFLQNRRIIFTIESQTSNQRRVNVEISQNSSMFFILHLFYNADLLDDFEQSKFKVFSLKFMNDVNILTYDTFTTINCRALKNAHKLCEFWAKRHEAHFVSIKYELIHLIKNNKRFDLSALINIKTAICASFSTIKMLNVLINSKLKWEFYLKFVQNKMIA